jgi:hypothetical protein
VRVGVVTVGRVAVLGQFAELRPARDSAWVHSALASQIVPIKSHNVRLGPLMNHLVTFVTVLSFLSGCASRGVMNSVDLEPGRLPSPNIALNIPSLGPCTDSPDRSLRLDSSQPINVLVHGCFGSSGQFRGLAQVLAFHAQQAICFTYDDRARLAQSATELRRAVRQLAEQTHVPLITVIGHSPIWVW